MFAQGLLDFAGAFLPQVKDYVQESLSDDLADISSSYLDSPGSCFWVAEVDGEIKGMVGVQRRSDDEAELRRMSVASDARRRGVGRKLLETVEEFCRKCGYARVRLTTHTMLKPAIALYRKNGYCMVADKTGWTVTRDFVKELKALD